MAQWRKVIVSGSSAVLNQISASGNIVPKADNGSDLGSSTLEWKDLYIDGTAYLDSATITAGTITGITDLVVADGGTGASTLTDGGILLGSGTDPITAMAALGDGEMIVGDGTTDPVAESGATLRTSIGVGTGDNVEFANTTVDTLKNDSAVGSSHITGSFTGSFVGDGSSLTGVAQDIDSLGALGGATLHQTEDFFHFSDNGTEKKITFSNLEDSIFANVSGDATVAAGGALTIAATSVEGSMLNDNVISGQGALGGASMAQADLLLIDDGPGTLKSVTFSNLEDSIFGNVSGDVLIAAGGAATIQANSVALGTDTTGNYMTDLSAGALIDVTHTPAEGSTGTIAVDLTEAGEAAIADGDYILFLDGGTTGTHAKEALADVTTLFAGDGLQAASSVMAVDVSDFAGTGLEDDGSENLDVSAAQTSITSIINASLGKIGTSASQEYITFGTANEVNTFIDNSEVLSVRSGGVDITGVATVSSDLTVAGNLDVNGTVTTIDSANTYIADKFMIMASGSSSDTDGGILVQNAAGAGYALGYDSGVDRWAFDADLAHNATDLGPDAYVGVVQVATTHGDSLAVPIYGGTTNGVGTIYVDTDDSEIWIYA